MSLHPPIFAIAGPTASGKTELGVDLALRLGNCEIINCDSVQIYKEIQIATAKPTADEMKGIPHHLISYVDPRQKYTAAAWADDAAQKIFEIESRNRIPILVGGTGFYLRSLREPLFESPKTDPAFRHRLNSIRERKSAEHLHRILQRVDPVTAGKLFPKDYPRVQRALEVYFQTGEPISQLQPNRAEPPEFARRIRVFALNPDREELYRRINERTQIHFDNGLIEEVRALREAGIGDETNALGSHGYRRVCEYLRGERSLDSAIEKSSQDVRNYAKRQMSWFRKEKGVVWLNGFGSQSDIKNRLFDVLSRS